MATKKFVPFEKSKKDKDPKGMKEQGKKDSFMDRVQGKAPPRRSGRGC